MAIRFNSASYLTRATALPASSSAFSACGWSKIHSQQPVGCIWKINEYDVGQVFIGTITTNTGLSVVISFGVDGSYPLYNPGTNTWFWWAIKQTGTQVKVMVAAAAATSWSASWTSNLGTAFAPDRMEVGGSELDEFSDTTIALLKVWDAVLTDDQLLAQKALLAPVVTDDLLSSHLMDGANVAADIVADIGGGTADFTLTGTGTTYDSAYPLTGVGTGSVAITSVTISGSTVTLAGTYSGSGTPTVAARLEAGASGTTQGPSAATAAAGNWSKVFTNVPPGVYTPFAAVTDPSGTTSESVAAIEIIGLSGVGELPSVYSVGSLSVNPESTATTVSGTVVLTCTDANGLPVPGVAFTSLSPAVATVTTPSNASGQVTVTGVATGSATVRGTYSDVVAGTLTDSSIIAVALLVPAAPTSLTATPLGSSAARLAWTDNASNETGFTVERATVSTGPWGSVATPSANVVAYDDTTVTPGLTYYYRVKAQNADGSSVYSNVATVAIPAAADVTPPTITLSSTALLIGIPNATIVLSASAADDRGVTEVRFYRNSVQIGQMLTAPNSGTQYTITQSFASSVDNGTISYTARAWDAAGNSTLSTPVVVTVSIPDAPVAPNAPSNLRSVLNIAGTVVLQWQDNADNETGFQLEQKLGATGTWQLLQTLPANSSLYEMTTLLASTTYLFRIRALGADVPSGYSNEATVTTVAPADTGLASIVASTDVLSDVPGVAASITYTAYSGNGSTRPGVTIRPFITEFGVATVAPANNATDASGQASFTVTFGTTVGQGQLMVTASDGQTTIDGNAAPVVTVFTLPAITEQLVKELLAEQQDPKYADEIQPYVFDFSPYFGRGETIASVLAIESVPTGGQSNDPDSARMIFGSSRVVGSRVLQFFRDGLPGVSYYLRCRVSTTIGRVVNSEIRIRVFRQAGARVSVSSPVAD